MQANRHHLGLAFLTFLIQHIKCVTEMGEETVRVLNETVSLCLWRMV